MDSSEITEDSIAEALRLLKLSGSSDLRWHLLDSWSRPRSGTRFFRFQADPGSHDLLVKTSPDWTPDDAERLHSAQDHLAEAVSAAGIEGAGVVRPLGWTGSPPLLVMPFLDATDLVTLLRDPERQEWSSMDYWMGVAGKVLAAFHGVEAAASNVDLSAATGEIRAVSASMRIPEGVVDRLLESIDLQGCCRSLFGDFGPGNLLGEPGGDLYLIDPPTEPLAGFFHRDLGNFLFEMRRQLAGRGFTPTRPLPGRFERLRGAFLDGYVAASSIDEPGAVDHGLMALFEMRRAAGMAKKRLPRRAGDALWFARLALDRRREVMRLASRPS